VVVANGFVYYTFDTKGSAPTEWLYQVPVNGGQPTVVANFNANSSSAFGALPSAGVTMAGGSIAGVTTSGGANGYGDVFELDPNTGRITDAGDFSADTGLPFRTCVNSAGNIYGAAYQTASGAKNAQSMTLFSVTSLKTDRWTGMGKDDNWSTDDNWSDMAPTSGDFLVFPANTPHEANTDNIPGLTVAGIEIEGESWLEGTEPLALQGNLKVDEGAGKPKLYLPLTLTANTNFVVGASAALQCESTITGKGMLTVGGLSGANGIYGLIYLYSDLATNLTLDSGTRVFQGVTGAASITVNGGSLLSSKTSDFSGNIILQGGIIGVAGNNPLGTGDLTVNAGSSTAYGGSTGNAAAATLDNLLIMKSGKLAWTLGSLYLGGPVTVAGKSEIEADQLTPFATVVRLAGKVGYNDTPGAVLTLGNAGTPGKIFLSGSLYTNVNVTGNVNLAGSLDGSGSLTLSNSRSLLVSAQSLPHYSGKIIVQAGTIAVSGTDPLGIGALLVTSTGPVQFDIKKSAQLRNKVVTGNATLFVDPVGKGATAVLTLTGLVTANPGLAIDAASTATLTFAKGSSIAGGFTWDGDGTLNLGGKLAGNSVIAVKNGTANKLSTFSGNWKNVEAFSPGKKKPPE
jgi:hypothetical protein